MSYYGVACGITEYTFLSLWNNPQTTNFTICRNVAGCQVDSVRYGVTNKMYQLFSYIMVYNTRWITSKYQRNDSESELVTNLRVKHKLYIILQNNIHVFPIHVLLFLLSRLWGNLGSPRHTIWPNGAFCVVLSYCGKHNQCAQ